MMAAKKDGLCSLTATAQKLIEEQGIQGPARNHPQYSPEDFCESEPTEPHMIKVPYPDDQNLKKLTKDIKFTQKSGVQLKNNEYGKVWTSIQNKKSHEDNSKNNMDQDLATKLKERSKKVDEEEQVNEDPPPPEFAQLQLRKTGSRELLNIE